MKVTVETITPEIAASMLECNTHNRPVRDKTVKKYAAIMSEGRWRLNGDSIRFDEFGALLDGQHRLLAVVLSGKPMQTLVCRGVQRAAMPTIDRQISRSAGDTLALQGVLSSTAVATGLAGIIAIERRAMFYTRQCDSLEPDAALDAYHKHPSIVESVNAVQGAARILKMPHGSATALHCLASEHGLRSQADRFFDALRTGAGLDAGDPALHLRTTLLADAVRHRKTHSGMKSALLFKAWNLWLAGTRIKLLRCRVIGPSPEPYPVPSFDVVP